MSEDLHITDHARERMLERGCSVDEVEETLVSGEVSRSVTKYQRKEKTFPVQLKRLEQRLREKRVEVIFLREGERTHVVSVVVRYVV
jgi:hypothetical protein